VKGIPRVIADRIKVWMDRRSSRPVAYRVFRRDFDIETRADHLDYAIGPLSLEAKESWLKACEVFDHALADWRTSLAVDALNISSGIRAKVPKEVLRDSVVTLLIDHSGSMKGQKILLAAAAAEIAADFLRQLTVTIEILGFTTAAWHGGRARKAWYAAGKPRDPGRLCDLLHIVYRAADDQQDGAPWSIRNMLRSDLLKENVDGEAVEWALERLRGRPETRKALVVVSDGAPIDDATLIANGRNETYLRDHLSAVLETAIQTGDVQIAAVGIAYGVGDLYPNSVRIDTPQDLGMILLSLLEQVLSSKSAEDGPMPSAAAKERADALAAGEEIIAEAENYELGDVTLRELIDDGRHR
jgi:cobaltochelatase CobT